MKNQLQTFERHLKVETSVLYDIQLMWRSHTPVKLLEYFLFEAEEQEPKILVCLSLLFSFIMKL
jgi:hypothetical protein